MKIWKTGAYSNNCTRFYARKSDTAFWECLLDATNGEHEFYIDRSKGYVEFGFEFDVMGSFGEWQYSGVFWTAAQSEEEKVEGIYIEMNGTVRDAEIYIYVNDKKVVSEDWIYSQDQHHWDLNSAIKVTVSHSGTCTRTTQELFARTLTGEEVVLNGRTGSYTMLVSPTAYVDIGYKFGVNTYTTLPYNDYFWFGKDHPNDTVEEITIHTSGTYWITNPCIEITVKGRKDGKGDTVILYHYYNDDLKI